jgi:hypothetical protein
MPKKQLVLAGIIIVVIIVVIIGVLWLRGGTTQTLQVPAQSTNTATGTMSSASELSENNSEKKMYTQAIFKTNKGELHMLPKDYQAMKTIGNLERGLYHNGKKNIFCISLFPQYPCFGQSKRIFKGR